METIQEISDDTQFCSWKYRNELLCDPPPKKFKT